MEVLEVFSNLADLYAKYGYKLYLVGGSVRDYLLRIPSSDLDLCTDATPDETKEFLPDANYRFSKFGTVSFNYDLYKVEITTLRVEQEYTDSRHPKDPHNVGVPSKTQYLQQYRNTAMIATPQHTEALVWRPGNDAATDRFMVG